MPIQRKQYSNDFKAEVALEAIQGMKTANEIASEYGVHPSQIAEWKKLVMQKIPDLFIQLFYLIHLSRKLGPV